MRSLIQISGHFYSFSPPRFPDTFIVFLPQKAFPFCRLSSSMQNVAQIREMLFKYAQCCSIWATFHVFEQHFVYLSVNNNTHIKKNAPQSAAKYILWGGKIHFGLCYTHMTSFQMISAFLNQTSASKSWPNFNFKKFTDVQPQSL